jgi:hypothetical protein
VEQLGAGSRAEGVQALLQLTLELVGSHGAGNAVLLSRRPSPLRHGRTRLLWTRTSYQGRRQGYRPRPIGTHHTGELIESSRAEIVRELVKVARDLLAPLTLGLP